MIQIESIIDAFSGGMNQIAKGFERGLTTLFGSSNARVLKKLQPNLEKINAFEPQMKALSDEELKAKTPEFRTRLEKGETLDDILPEAFAVCREASQRVLGMRHYDVQMIGGMVLHGGDIAEMVTGEGKTLVATLPAYLNAIDGKGVHVVTVNDYLARRDMEWMAPLYRFLGLTVGAIQSQMEADARQQAYQCDITYGTNNEFGFDYLRDNMRPAAMGDDRYPASRQQVQGPLHFAIVDEVDNILIDEARTPLIIAGPSQDDTSRYKRADQIARQLRPGVHFEVKEKEHTCNLTDDGVRKAEELAGVESFYTAGNMEWPHLIDNALKAHHLYKMDVNYIIKDGEIVIVDEFTGRLMPGRHWSDGLHQAVEAKENVKIKEESQTLATITLQNFFKLYDKICGMTGTAMTEANEFWKIYKLDVVAIPTNRTMQRLNQTDVIYCTEADKFNAIVDEVERLNRFDTVATSTDLIVGKIIAETDTTLDVVPVDEKTPLQLQKSQIKKIERHGRPVLIGTVSIEKSELLSRLLDKRGIKHEVLNAKYHQREAEIISQAGRRGAVTIATNMAGRGTDIILGGNPDSMAWAILQSKYPTRLEVPDEEWNALVAEIENREHMKAEGRDVAELGGLHVVGSERHEARRIDNQLRGRCGRQGDPGSSRFFLSLEDDLMRIFAGEWVRNILTRLGGVEPGKPISEFAIVSRRIEGAQKKVEERNFEIRKHLLEYDEVMDTQRKRVYGYRQNILDGVETRQLMLDMVAGEVRRHVGTFLDPDYGAETFAAWVSKQLSCSFRAKDFRGMDYSMSEVHAKDQAERDVEKQVFEIIDENLPEDSDPSEWLWESLAHTVNTRWHLSVNDRELRKIGREELPQELLERANQAIQKVDLGEGAKFLEPEFPLETTCAWVKHKFGIALEPAELQGREALAVEAIVLEKAKKAYDAKEVRFPLLAAFSHFTLRDAQGNRFIDPKKITEWAWTRFGVDLGVCEPDQLQSRCEDESRHMFETGMQKYLELVVLQQKVTEYAESHHGRVTRENCPPLAELFDWCEAQSLQLPETSKLRNLTVVQLNRVTRQALDDRYRPEMSKVERMLLLEILDQSWKEHLLTMDHLRSAVGLRGYAQTDPKVEYKREGMKMFEEMWGSVEQRVTDLAYRIEQLDDSFIGSTWAKGQVQVRTAPPSMAETDIGQQQQDAIEGTQADKKPEPLRNFQPRVGRNDPCPCGSGKKFKKCCGQNR
ncbi:MAG: SEC-C metal-binding domain-containing protein [Thermoguttaceae bacterium]|nr:SEC-C metal-binding domain-containing protein [Thermoguttaceae bacterium]